VELEIVVGREGKQLRAQRIQGDAHSPSDLLKMALSGPDTPGFYFWGYVKQTVYNVRIHNVQHLKQRIREVAASVTPDVHGRVWQEVEYHLDVCRATSGVHIEL
jgi:hypothetical protein